MSRPPETVYSSTHPDVIAWFDASQTAFEAYHEACKALKARLPEDAVLYQRTSDRGGALVGIDCTNKPSEAWRSSSNGWVPYKNHKKDPAVSTLWAACRYHLDPIPGQPQMVSTEPMRTTSAGARRFAGVVWCSWAAPAEQVESKNGVDSGLWTRRKLSEYWAAIEEETEA